MSYRERAQAVMQAFANPTVPATTVQKSPLLNLPAELRNEIYSRVLVSRPELDIRFNIPSLLLPRSRAVLSRPPIAFFFGIGTANAALIKHLTIIPDISDVVDLWENRPKAFRVDVFPYGHWLDFARALIKAGVELSNVEMADPVSFASEIEDIIGSRVPRMYHNQWRHAVEQAEEEELSRLWRPRRETYSYN